MSIPISIRNTIDHRNRIHLFNGIELVSSWLFWAIDWIVYVGAIVAIAGTLILGAYYIFIKRKSEKLIRNNQGFVHKIAFYGAGLMIILSILTYSLNSNNLIRYPLSLSLAIFAFLFLLEYPIRVILSIIDRLVFVYSYFRGDEDTCREIKSRMDLGKLYDARKKYLNGGDKAEYLKLLDSILDTVQDDNPI